MKRNLRPLLSLVLTPLALASLARAQEPLRPQVAHAPRPHVAAESRPTFAPDEILVRYRSTNEERPLQRKAVETEMGLALISSNPILEYYRYRLPQGMTVAEALRRLRGDQRLQYVEPNYIVYLHAVPNDSFYDNYQSVTTDLQKWYFDGIGADRNLNAEAAWDIVTGRSDVVVAIIDSGIDLDHPDLAANIWTNPGEIPGNGSDDDGNGFVDDVNGWDFYFGDNDPNPDLGNGIDDDGVSGPDSNTFHGTFAAGCAGAVTNNGTGVAGAAWDCSLMAIKIFTDDGGAFTSDIADGITYAGANGADVINMSFGGGGFSSTVNNAVSFAFSQGSVLLASAGNGNSSAAQFPASYTNVISVGASDSGSALGGGSGDIDGRASFSQYGTAAVDVVAPGSDLVSTAVNSVANGNAGSATYFISSGTSFSCPTVAGLAALLVARARDLGTTLSNADVVNIIQTQTVDLPDDPNDSPNGGSTWDGQGRVDFLAAVNAVQGGGPTNDPPVANAGPNQNGDTGQTLTFDGTGSSDPNGDPLTYSWNFGDGTNGSGAVVTHAYASAGTYIVTLTVDDGQATDSDTATVTVSNPTGGGPTVLLASTGSQALPGFTARNEDIFSYDPGTGTFALYFDGSDVGLGSAALSGFTVLSNGDILFSLTAAFSIAGMTGGPGGSTTADDSDIVQFTPSQLGTSTSGVFTFFFDGSDVGLTTNGEDIDAISVSAGGNLVISTTGSNSVAGLGTQRDEDLLEFFASSFGAATSGSFATYFDGSDVGLASSSSEDVRALSIDGNGDLYLSTVGSFSVAGASGDDEDVFRFTPTSLGSATSGSFSPFLDGSAIGIPTTADIMGVSILN